jgi:hypothetical protein
MGNVQADLKTWLVGFELENSNSLEGNLPIWIRKLEQLVMGISIRRGIDQFIPEV